MIVSLSWHGRNSFHHLVWLKRRPEPLMMKCWLHPEASGEGGGGGGGEANPIWRIVSAECILVVLEPSEWWVHCSALVQSRPVRALHAPCRPVVETGRLCRGLAFISRLQWLQSAPPRLQFCLSWPRSRLPAGGCWPGHCRLAAV